MAKFAGSRTRLRVLTAEAANGELIGIAPLCIRQSAWPHLSVLEIIGGQWADYLDLLYIPSYGEFFLDRVNKWIKENNEWRVLNFRSLRSDLAEATGHQHGAEPQAVDVCPYATLPKSAESFRARLPKQLQTILLRKGDRLARQGRLRFSVSQTVSELEIDLAVFFELHQNRQRTKGERGRFFDPRTKALFSELSRALLAAGSLRLGLLQIDERPAAALYNLRLHDGEYFYSAGMEPTQSGHSPGTLLHWWMIQQAIDQGMKTYDFGRGAEPYKSWWADAVCQLFGVTKARSIMDDLFWRGWQSFKRTIYRSRWVKRLYLATIGRFQDHSVK